MTQTHSRACCETPPIISKGYEPKGTYTTIDGLKTYVTGPPMATQAILLIYDIFGFFPQTLQGADILARPDRFHQYRVYMPDFFEGSPADISWYPPDTKEKGEKLGNFFKTTGAPQKSAERLPKIMKAIEQQYEGIKEWGVVGFCWGGKIVNLTAGQGLYKAAAIAHPALLSGEDAKGVKCPILVMPTKDESKEDVEAYEKGLTVKKEVVWFEDQVHGFMAARADLEDEKVVQAYKKAYQKMLTWFRVNM